MSFVITRSRDYTPTIISCELIKNRSKYVKVITTSIRITELLHDDFFETIVAPSKVDPEYYRDKKFNNLDENGLIKIGSDVNKGDCLATRIRENISDGTIEDTSVYAKIEMSGRVTNIKIKKCDTPGTRIIFIEIEH